MRTKSKEQNTPCSFALCSTEIMTFRQKLRIAWIIALIATVLVLVWLAAVPGGKITYVQDFKGFNDFIGNLTPTERMASNKIIGDPVYFSLRVPRRFTSAKLTLKYKVDPSVPIIEAGVLKDRATWQYDLQPIYNGKIDELMKNWNVLWEGNVMLLQREKKFATIDDFLKNPPAFDKIALYNYNLKNNFIFPGYISARATTTICRPLTGTYQFYTYIKNENLSDDFVFEDLNKELDSDPVDVFVYYNDKQISAEHLDDDGVVNDSGAQKSWRHLKINLANLPEGVYKIGVRADNDIITRTITTAQSKMAFVNKINLADTPEVSCGRNLITDSRKIQAQTVYADKLQTINIEGVEVTEKSPLGRGAEPGEAGRVSGQDKFSSTTLSITELFTQFSTQGDLPKMSYLILQNDGVAISGDGLFSFSESQFFNPIIRKVDANFDADKEGINYVLANYTPPTRDGEWMISTAEFDLQNVYKQWNKHSFLISVPGLRAEDNTGAGVVIGEIKIELQGTSLWEKVKKMLNAK
jgi:hypothetical protein